jgi:hypothetical protein
MGNGAERGQLGTIYTNAVRSMLVDTTEATTDGSVPSRCTLNISRALV